ncbi:hypothetical protein COT94_02400 [Candidatus Falkowbacteria bacterium CG10_big_fil_rev_8_21_14_0_10_37_14]|uniref:Chromosome partition protein Smc n=1 Tax=Candidatus Falkowbacteria bacterium CG10_big_fil_rev_8_21_14_0_10_37_14 TaxID=1974561 RepID=A0A2M6WTI0_9BACT|nr:AAA family ATPase [Candidatus Falkowbacteria bacterium]PIT96090.1 MAG: hypothetical protein COT94_02400 [Candidatus Falkowbacteria bacterium CG10_big_fil_rev_8_21_14_0_10_37_14]
MYLEKLVVQGFKSFASKNELIFPGGIKDGKHGLTAIVGPNGSGKSNVADAVRWALGEQSMKTLRGKKSEDIIFSGSDKRGQLGMAEVSLYLNNEDKQGDLDYSQIVLTRRLFRDGNSEYLINGSRVRLLDVQMMLAKANFGQKTYSVIGQGMVEGFLNTSLSERKEFFDEATGVKQYQIKREDALNKLRASIENLGQSQMLVAEIEPRLKVLSKQIARLEKRGVMESELADLQLNYYAYQWQTLAKKLEAARSGVEVAWAESQKYEATIKGLEKTLAGLASEQTVSQEFDSWQNKLSELRAEGARLERRGGNLSAWLVMSQSVNNFSEVGNDLEQAESAWHEAKQAVLSLNQQDRRPRIAELGNSLVVLERQRADILKELNRLDAWMEMKLEAVGKYDVSFLTNRRSELAFKITELNKELAIWEATFGTDKLKLESWRSRQVELATEIKRLNEEWRNLSATGTGTAAKEVNARLERLLNKLEKAEQAAEWSAIKLALAEIRSELTEAINYATGQVVEKKLAVLSERLIKVTAKREEIQNEINEVSLNIATVQEKIRLSKNQLEILNREVIDNDKKLIKAEEKFDADGARKERAEVNHRQLEIAEKIKTLFEELTALKLADEEQRLIWSNAHRKAEETERRFNELSRKIQEERLVVARQEAKREELERLIVADGVLIFDTETVAKAIEQVRMRRQILENELAEVKAKLDGFNAEQETKRRRLVECQQSLGQAQSLLSHSGSVINEQKMEAVRHETRLEDLEIEIHENYDHLDRLKKYQVGESLAVEETYNKIKYLRRQLEMIGSVDEEASKDYMNTKERYDFLSGQINDLVDTTKGLEDVIKELDGTIRERFDREFETIATKFEEYFRILFNGGNAKIVKVMSDELDEEDASVMEENTTTDNPMAGTVKKIKALSRINATGLAGIEIVATPPGKKIKSIAMLSGGERALTAIALISAIISANPSPFVVLDEVDAALDEANSERLARILEDLSEKTQFIVITHNRAPMRKAAILYGVTMQEDGVSKLLSVKLEDVKIENR